MVSFGGFGTGDDEGRSGGIGWVAFGADFLRGRIEDDMISFVDSGRVGSLRCLRSTYLMQIGKVQRLRDGIHLPGTQAQGIPLSSIRQQLL